MLETMYAEEGIGLAATQVDIHERIIVMDLSEERNDPKIFINPAFAMEFNIFADDSGDPANKIFILFINLIKFC